MDLPEKIRKELNLNVNYGPAASISQDYTIPVLEPSVIIDNEGSAQFVRKRLHRSKPEIVASENYKRGLKGFELD